MSNFWLLCLTSLLALRNVNCDVCFVDTGSTGNEHGDCQCSSAPPQLPLAPRFNPRISCGVGSCDSWTEERDLSTNTCVCRLQFPMNGEFCQDPCFETCDRSTQICKKIPQGFECQDTGIVDNHSFRNQKVLHIRDQAMNVNDIEYSTSETGNVTVVFVLLGVCLGVLITSVLLVLIATSYYRQRARKRVFSFRNTDCNSNLLTNEH